MKTQQEMLELVEELSADQDKLFNHIDEIMEDIEVFKLAMIRLDATLPCSAFIFACDAKHLIEVAKEELA